jgi:hypothetical protein
MSQFLKKERLVSEKELFVLGLKVGRYELQMKVIMSRDRLLIHYFDKESFRLKNKRPKDRT